MKFRIDFELEDKFIILLLDRYLSTGANIHKKGFLLYSKNRLKLWGNDMEAQFGECDVHNNINTIKSIRQNWGI